MANDLAKPIVPISSILAVVALIFLLQACSSTKITDSPFEDKLQQPVNPLLIFNSNAVVRDNLTEVDLISPDRAILKVSEAITILNPEAREHGKLVLFYDQFRSIDYVKGVVRNASGEIIRKLDENDINDYTATSSYSLYDDSRARVLEIYHNDYPYTVEYEYQMTYNGTLNLPGWYPQESGVAIENATLEYRIHNRNEIRYHTSNIEADPQILPGEVTTYRWNINNVPAVSIEKLGPPASEQLPGVLVTPLKFHISGYDGSFTDWKSFGKWYYDLGKDARILPEEVKNDIDNLIGGLDSERQIVEMLYEYLQREMRYVSVQLGIGGWKPFDVEYVYRTKYGDCKALTNFMQAILEYAGIDSYPVLLRSGVNTPGLIKEFPSNQFNHVLLYVELGNGEELWLECTSKYIPAGHVGFGNQGKTGLMVTSEGGKLINLPNGSADQNRRMKFHKIALTSGDNPKIETEIDFSGAMQDYIVSILTPKSEKEKANWIRNEVGFSIDKLTAIEFTKQWEENRTNLSYSYTSPDLVTAVSNRIFITFDKFNWWNFDINPGQSRNQPILLPILYSDVDSFEINVPDGYDIENIPDDIRIDYPFAAFNYNFDTSEFHTGTIKVERVIRYKQRKIDKDQFEDYKKFWNEIKSANQQQLVLVNKR